MGGNGTAITDREAAVYDRQIRLWGAAAQQRLRSARVLVCGAFDGVAAELTKNLVLAGVSCTIHDSKKVGVESSDRGANFFLSSGERAAGSRAEASLEAVRELNPLVEVGIETRPLNAFDDELLSSFQIVCVCGASEDEKTTLNAACRKLGVAFFAAGSSGFIGYMFSDIGDGHEYVETVKRGEGDETTTTKSTIAFCDYATAMGADWKTFSMKRRKRMPDAYFALASLAHDGDWESLCASHGVDPSFADRASVERVAAELASPAGISPVCAIVGGIVGQEVIKAISGKDRPICNWFFYDALVGSGQERRVPPLQEGDKSAESKKRKADVALLDVGVEVQGQGDVAKKADEMAAEIVILD